MVNLKSRGFFSEYLKNYFHFYLLFVPIFFLQTYGGQAHNIVRAERVVLNFMQRMSGIATVTKVL